MRNIVVLGRKGGISKTTTAVHLAAALTDKGNRVLLADGDGNLSALNWARRGQNELPFAVVDASFEGEAVGKSYRENKPYDCTVLDTPAALEPRKLDALLAREETVLVLPTTPDALALTAMLDTVADLEDAKRRVTVPPYYALICRARVQAPKDADAAVAMLEAQGVSVLKARVREAVAFQRAALGGVLVRDMSEYGAVATNAQADYTAALDELLARSQTVPA